MFQPSKEDRTVYNLDVAYGIVREKLSEIDVAEQCRHSGAELQPDGTVILEYLNQPHRIKIEEAGVSRVDDSKELSLREKILVLRYFTQAKGAPLVGKQVTYRDLPGGLVYYPTFMKRTINPLTDRFGKDAAALAAVGEVLGARKGDTGDASLIIYAFPLVPVNIILWEGDEELSPQVNLLFDAGILDYLESEDVTIVTEIMTWRLINLARTS